MNVFKIIAWLLGILIALLVAVFIYISLNLNGLIKRTVEEVGPRLTQTPVTLDKVDLSLKEGRVSLYGFSVANPGGFTAERAFAFEEFTLQLDPNSLTESVKVIENIVISGINVTAEQKGTTTNLQQLKKAIDRYLPPGGGENSEPSAGGGLLFMVEKLSFENVGLTVITEKYGEKSAKIPGFTQTNIGSRQQGVTVEQLGRIILKSLTDKAKRVAEDELESRVTEEVKEKAKDKVREKAGEELDKLKDLL